MEAMAGRESYRRYFHHAVSTILQIHQVPRRPSQRHSAVHQRCGTFAAIPEIYHQLWTMMVTKEASMQAYNVRIPCANAYLCLACSVLVDCCSSWKIIIEDCLELALHVKEVHLSVE